MPQTDIAIIDTLSVHGSFLQRHSSCNPITHLCRVWLGAYVREGKGASHIASKQKAAFSVVPVHY